jgi:small-conductance mechanosensitive channel
MRPIVRSALVLLLLSIAFSTSAQQQQQQAPAQQPAPQQPQQPPATAAAGLPTPDQILQYLRKTIAWHEQLHEEEQLANTTEESTFLDDERQVAKQILQLSFDFAKAAAKLISRQAAPSSTEESPDVPGYSGLSRAAAQTDRVVKDTQAELEETKRKADAATGQKQKQLQSTADELQSELNLAKARSDTYKSILQFLGSGAGASFPSQINQLQQSVPELSEAKPTAAPAPAAAVAPARNPNPLGLIEVITNLFSLSSKMRSLDAAMAATDALAETAKSLRNPIVKNMIAAAHRGEELAKAADTAGPAELEQQKRELDALTANFKDISSVVVPLGQQNLSLGIYKETLTRWKDSVHKEYLDELRYLVVRAVLLGIALAVVFTLGEFWRKATLRYVKDIRRRYQFLLLRRIVLWCAVGITIAFALATEIGSLATFAGLITAGIAVALQNVILAIAGYFFLVGKYGVRVGDRVQISGVTGNVVDIGLVRLHLMELASTGNDRQPTGRVVVFSNSIVFQPTASFFKQIPGTNFVWHEVTLILSPDSDYHQAEERMLGAVNKVYATYSSSMEEQHRHMEQSFALAVDVPQPRSRLRLTQTGLEVVIRYPLELEKSAEIDDQISRELLIALEKAPKLKLVGSGTPNIQPVLDGSPAA